MKWCFAFEKVKEIFVILAQGEDTIYAHTHTRIAAEKLKYVKSEKRVFFVTWKYFFYRQKRNFWKVKKGELTKSLPLHRDTAIIISVIQKVHFKNNIPLTRSQNVNTKKAGDKKSVQMRW